jgi:hypothetical protein
VYGSVFLPNPRHNIFDDRFYFVLRQCEATTFGNDPNSFASTIYDHLASLAFVEVVFELCPHFGTDGVLQVIAELCQKLSASEHQGCCFPGQMKCFARLSRSIKRPRSNRAFRAAMLRSNAVAASSVDSCSRSRNSTTTRYFSGRRNTAALTSSSRWEAANNCSGFSAQFWI